MQPKYTAEQWDRISPAMRNLAVGTVAMARAVLVDGKRPSEIAKEMGESRQLVNAAIKRVRDVLDKHQEAGLVPVMVWLPPELAAQVHEMAKPYMEAKPAQKKAGIDV
uniref:Putative transcriptional regulator n=1 Tax=Pseudomonas sp. GLE121 TaxID=1329969 RepID=R4LBT4_9PSED|nr:TrfB-related DNA-binding protein [Pseudomonas sp. GLE121]AGL12861.1 putative transcriptional regulator [Pseudomonas sp. GLE121]